MYIPEEIRLKSLQINSYKYVLFNISKAASKMSAAPFPFSSPICHITFANVA